MENEIHPWIIHQRFFESLLLSLLLLLFEKLSIII